MYNNNCGCVDTTTIVQTCGDDPCSTQITCPIPPTDASCIYFNLVSDGGLPCIGVQAGTNLKTILEKIDVALCALVPFNFSSYNLGCLNSPTTISTFKEFAEKVATDVCTTKTNVTTLTNSVNILSATIASINVPVITDSCSIGILATDTIKQILQKLVTKICSLPASSVDSSPILTTIDSNSVSFTTSGTKNHNISADVKISNDADNILEERVDGLYVPDFVESAQQTLSYNPGTRELTISAGNTVTLPPDLDNQTLGLNLLTKVLSITGGNDVDFTPLFSAIAITETSLTANDSTTIDFTTSGTSNHVLTATVKVDGTGPNALSATPNGLYVTPENPLAVVDSNSINLTTSGANGHTLTADVKIDSTVPNALTLSPEGLLVVPELTLYTFANGIRNDGSTIKLGNTIIEDTLLEDVANAFDFAINTKSFTYGNDYATHYNVAGAEGVFRVLNTLSSDPSIGTFGSLENLIINISDNIPNGRGLASRINVTTYTADSIANIDIPNSTPATSVYASTSLDLFNTNITVDQGGLSEIRALSTIYSTVNLVNQASLNTSVVDYLANIVIASPYKGVSDTNVPAITNYFGLVLNASDTFVSSGITNRYGIYQEGDSDINVFNGKTRVAELSLGTGASVPNTVAASVDNTVTNTVEININGVTYKLLARV